MNIKTTHTAILIDDEKNNIENLEILLHDFCPDIIVIAKETNLKKAKESIIRLQPDILFLDIQMGNRTIFDLLEELNVITSEIIFVTAHDTYALKAFDYNTIDYLLKPVDILKLQKAVNKAIFCVEKKKSEQNMNTLSNNLVSLMGKITFPVQRGFRLEYIKNIQYMVAQGSYSDIHFSNKKPLLVSKNLKHYEMKLAEYDFIRIHPSALINFQYVEELDRSDGGCIIMEGGKRLPISKQKRLELEKMLRENG